MVLFFKRQVYKSIFKGILWITVASMVVGAAFSVFSKRAGRRVAITIDDESIDYQDFARREKAKREQLAMMRYQFEQMGLPLEKSLRDIDSKKLAMSGLLEDTLLSRVAKELNICLNEEYVSAKLTDPYYLVQRLTDFFPSYLAVSQDFDSDVLARMLRRNGMGLADFESFIERDLERKVVRDIALNALYNPVFMVRKEYSQKYAAKKFSVVNLSLDSFVQKEKKASLSDEEVGQFFNEHNRDYAVAEKRSGIMWEFSPENYVVALTDDKIHDYYEHNKSKFVASPAKLKVRRILFKVSNPEDLAAAKVKAEAVLAEVTKNPASFAEKAKQYSEDATTAKNGGLVEFFTRGEKEENFEKAAFRLKEDREISPIAQTKDGLEIIQRLERRAIEYKSLALVRNEIRDLLTKQEFKRGFDEDMERLVHAATTNAAVVESFVQNKKAKQSVLKNIEKDDSLKGERLFKLKNGGFGYYQDQNRGVLIQLTKIDKSHIPDLSTIKSRVVGDLYKTKAEKSLILALNKVQQRAESSALSEMAKEYGTKVTTVNWLKSGDTDRIQELTNQGLPAVQMLQMEKVGGMIAYRDGENTCLVRMEAVEGVKQGEFEQKKMEINQSLMRSNSFVTLNGFVASLARNVTLRTDEKSLELDHFDQEQS